MSAIDIIQKAAQCFPLEPTGGPFQKQELQRIRIVRRLVSEIEKERIKNQELKKQIKCIKKENKIFVDNAYFNGYLDGGGKVVGDG